MEIIVLIWGISCLDLGIVKRLFPSKPLYSAIKQLTVAAFCSLSSILYIYTKQYSNEQACQLTAAALRNSTSNTHHPASSTTTQLLYQNTECSSY